MAIGLQDREVTSKAKAQRKRAAAYVHQQIKSQSSMDQHSLPEVMPTFYNGGGNINHQY